MAPQMQIHDLGKALSCEQSEGVPNSICTAGGCASELQASDFNHIQIWSMSSAGPRTSLEVKEGKDPIPILTVIRKGL